MHDSEQLAIAKSSLLASNIHELYIRNLQSAKELETKINNRLKGRGDTSREAVIQMLEEAMVTNDKAFEISSRTSCANSKL